MAKVDSAAITALKALFETGDTITQPNLADLIDTIAEAAEAHSHVSTGGDGSGTGDASFVVNLQSGTAAAKPATPAVGDVYLETDTSKLYVCFVAEAWTEIVNATGKAPDSASYVTISAEGDLSNETLHSAISGASLHDPKAHAASHQNAGADEISVAGLSGELADDQPPKAHDLAGAKHNAATLAELNNKVSDATLDDSSDPRDPNAHDLAGAAHNAATLAQLNNKISDATLDDASDSRTPSAHKSSHAGGGSDKLKYTRQIVFIIPGTLAVGTNLSAEVTYRGPNATIVRADGRVKTAPTGAALIFDLNISGTSIWNVTPANRLQIAASATSGTQTSFDDTTITDGEVVTIDIDQIGSTVAGADATVLLELECNPEAD